MTPSYRSSLLRGGHTGPAAAIMLLAELGKVSLDDLLGNYLAGTSEAGDGITVGSLLNHSLAVRLECNLPPRAPV